ncbi:MAG: hypothetical protein ACI8PT_002200 [Gammaproteobacteria bacterium]|jgi:hypothetical protein
MGQGVVSFGRAWALRRGDFAQIPRECIVQRQAFRAAAVDRYTLHRLVFSAA